MRVWRALGYDGQSLVLIPLVLIVYWWSGPEGGPTIKWLGVWFIFVVAWVYARLRSRSENEQLNPLFAGPERAIKTMKSPKKRPPGASLPKSKAIRSCAGLAIKLLEKWIGESYRVLASAGASKKAKHK